MLFLTYRLFIILSCFISIPDEGPLFSGLNYSPLLKENSFFLNIKE